MENYLLLLNLKHSLFYSKHYYNNIILKTKKYRKISCSPCGIYFCQFRESYAFAGTIARCSSYLRTIRLKSGGAIPISGQHSEICDIRVSEKQETFTEQWVRVTRPASTRKTHILVQFTIYRRPRIGRSDQSKAYVIS